MESHLLLLPTYLTTAILQGVDEIPWSMPSPIPVHNLIDALLLTLRLTSLLRFSIANVRKPICRLLSSAKRLVGPTGDARRDVAFDSGLLPAVLVDDLGNDDVPDIDRSLVLPNRLDDPFGIDVDRLSVCLVRMA